MHPIVFGFRRIPPHPVTECENQPIQRQKNLVRRWIGGAIKNWQRQKMIATLGALDTRILRDIGIERCDIERVVDGFHAREKCMALKTWDTKEVTYGTVEGFKKAA